MCRFQSFNTHLQQAKQQQQQVSAQLAHGPGPVPLRHATTTPLHCAGQSAAAVLLPHTGAQLNLCQTSWGHTAQQQPANALGTPAATQPVHPVSPPAEAVQTATAAAAAAAAWGQPAPVPSAPSFLDSMHSQTQTSDASQPGAADPVRQSSSLANAAAYQNVAGSSTEPNAPPALASAQSASPSDAAVAVPTLLPLCSASSHAVVGGQSQPAPTSGSQQSPQQGSAAVCQTTPYPAGLQPGPLLSRSGVRSNVLQEPSVRLTSSVPCAPSAFVPIIDLTSTSDELPSPASPSAPTFAHPSCKQTGTAAQRPSAVEYAATRGQISSTTSVDHRSNKQLLSIASKASNVLQISVDASSTSSNTLQLPAMQLATRMNQSRHAQRLSNIGDETAHAQQPAPQTMPQQQPPLQPLQYAGPLARHPAPAHSSRGMFAEPQAPLRRHGAPQAQSQSLHASGQHHAAMVSLPPDGGMYQSASQGRHLGHLQQLLAHELERQQTLTRQQRPAWQAHALHAMQPLQPNSPMLRRLPTVR